MKFRKKMLSVLLAIALLGSIWPQSVIAEVLDESPGVCIAKWRAVHISATVLATGLGFTPFKAAEIAADLAAHAAELELKHCAPVLEVPDDKLFLPDSNNGCAVTLTIPISLDNLNRLVLDKQIVDLVMNDPSLSLPDNFVDELEGMLRSEFGHYANSGSGSYTNFYFVVEPDSTAVWPGYWGELGNPHIEQFNSDVVLNVDYPGERVNALQVVLPVGSHTVTWTADTLISTADFVWIPPGLGDLPGPADDVAKKKAAKKGWKATVKGWIDSAKKVGSDIYTDFAQNRAKKSRANLKKFGRQLLNDIAEGRAQDEAVGRGVSAVDLVLDDYFLDGNTHGKTTQAFQKLFVIDQSPPMISGNVPIVVEALEPGGVSSANHISALRAGIQVSDNCDTEPDLTYSTPRFWPLSLQEDGSSVVSEISWTAKDNGAVDENGGVNETTVMQAVTVVDTKPPILVAPPPVIMEISAGELMTVDLGIAQTFDVADLQPAVTNDAPSQFMQGVYEINWSATDFSGNVSEPTKDSVQIVNLKEPGTNLLPTAFDQTGGSAVAATSFEPVRITVRGQDGDPTPDPLWFAIEDQPENGFFIAPLYPYFIEDYRLSALYSPAIAAMTSEEYARSVSSLEGGMPTFMRRLCDPNDTPHPNIPENAGDLRDDLFNDFVYWDSSKYMAVDDNGYTYVYDRRYTRCNQNNDPQTEPRLSVWDADGLFVGEILIDGRPLKDTRFNIPRETIITVRSLGSSGESVVKLFSTQLDNADEPVVETHSYGLWRDINRIRVGASDTLVWPKFERAGSAAWDDEQQVLYVIGDSQYRREGLAAFTPAVCDDDVDDPNADPERCLDLVGVPIYVQSLNASTNTADYNGVGFDALQVENVRDIALDSEGAVYVTVKETMNEGFFNRIFKFAPAETLPDGSIKLGELVGWLGRCDSGPNCDYINQRSIGFSCTNETCFVDDDYVGSEPGQFNSPGAIAFDANDVLYVADTGNSRVQRFSPDGLFAARRFRQVMAVALYWGISADPVLLL